MCLQVTQTYLISSGCFIMSINNTSFGIPDCMTSIIISSHIRFKELKILEIHIYNLHWSYAAHSLSDYFCGCNGNTIAVQFQTHSLKPISPYMNIHMIISVCLFLCWNKTMGCIHTWNENRNTVSICKVLEKRFSERRYNLFLVLEVLREIIWKDQYSWFFSLRLNIRNGL